MHLCWCDDRWCDVHLHTARLEGKELQRKIGGDISLQPHTEQWRVMTGDERCTAQHCSCAGACPVKSLLRRLISVSIQHGLKVITGDVTCTALHLCRCQCSESRLKVRGPSW